MATTAREYFKAADGHRRAVELLQPYELGPNGGRDSLFLAIYNLLGFSVELYLKAFLAKSGLQDSDLRKRDYGHDLANLFDAARQHGFDVRLADMTAIVSFMAPGHGDYGYRYVQDGGTLNYFNDLYPVIDALRAVHFSMQDELI